MTLTKEKKKTLALVIVSGLVVLVVSYLFGFQWINRARAQTDLKVAELNEKVEKTKQTIEAGEAAEKKIEEIKELLNPFQEQMPASPAETWLTKAIYEVASKHKLTLKGSRVVEPDPFVLSEMKGVAHLGLEGYGFNVQGTYFQLGEFLADLEGSYPFIVVESITITAGWGGEPNIHDMAVKITMITQKG